MDIVIKSFNRPYYLDRCLYSIVEFVQNYNLHTITVLDDGTPQIYLDALLDKYPFVHIKKSNFHADKSAYCSAALKESQDKFKSSIPARFWRTEIAKCSSYFVLLEEDMWFVSPINLDLLLPTNKEETNWVQLKLFWLSNDLLIASKQQKTKETYTIYRPNLPSTSEFWFTHVFDKKYGFKVHKALTFFGFYSIAKWLRYYSLYSVAGVILSKVYYEKLWHNAPEYVDENTQLKKALKLYNASSNKMQYAHTHTEVLKTGFCSTSAPSVLSKKCNWNVFVGNAILNQAWLNGDFKTTESLGADLDLNNLFTILQNANHPYATAKAWRIFNTEFKNQYTQLGCKII